MTDVFSRLATTFALLAILVGLVVLRVETPPLPSAAANPISESSGRTGSEGEGFTLLAVTPLPAISNAFVDRPLFNENRKKEAEKTTAGPPPTDEGAMPSQSVAAPRDLKLVAVFGLLTEPLAIVRSGHPPKDRWVGVGDMIESWRVDAIDADGLTLRHGDRVLPLPLYPNFDIAK